MRSSLVLATSFVLLARLAAAAPAVPQLSHDNWDGDGNFVLTWNLWWGENADSWRIEEDGAIIGSGALTAASPNPQTANLSISGRAPGTYTYQAFLQNGSGTTSSNLLELNVGDPPVNPGTGGTVLVDGDDDALQLTVALNSTTDYDLSLRTGTPQGFSVLTNNPSVLRVSLVGEDTLRVEALAPGRAGVRIEDASGARRILGFRVKEANGALPGWPRYLAIGSVSEDTTPDLAFWQGFGEGLANRRTDVRYIYINGGYAFGWRTWTNVDGGRAITFIRESKKLGMIPLFVYYQIPGGDGESYFTDRQHIESADYLQQYYRDLAFLLDIIRTEGGDEPVGLVLEPDFIGYMMQNANQRPDQIQAMTGAAYTAGILQRGVDPDFPETLTGLVQSINYLIRREAPKAFFGWQLNLWASPGISTPIGIKGLMHKTDDIGITAGRAAIRTEAGLITQYYLDAGITSHGADFLSIDKYGLDGAATSNPQDPASSTWFWNADHWTNYLVFVKALHETADKPIVLWQLPVGHINSSLAVDAQGQTFPDLNNTSTHYEDSSPTFFLGDRFSATGARHTFFATNQGNDPKISASGNTIQWGSHMQETMEAGVIAALFGAGVGDSTDGVGAPPTDAHWWITAVQRYYQSPIPLPGTEPSVPVGLALAPGLLIAAGLACALLARRIHRQDLARK